MKATHCGPRASSLLFPAVHRRLVLSLLLLHPERSLHVREIARLTGTPAGTVNKELIRLHEAELLNRERVGNQVRYSANRSHQIYPELAGILRKTVGLADVLMEALAPLTSHVKLACVFGSMARGTETAGSDIDLLIIGDAEFGAVVEAFHPAQQELRREINPKVYSVREWKGKIRSKDPFVREIMIQPKTFLIGSGDDLAELGRRKP